MEVGGNLHTPSATKIPLQTDRGATCTPQPSGRFAEEKATLTLLLQNLNLVHNVYKFCEKILVSIYVHGGAIVSILRVAWKKLQN